MIKTKLSELTEETQTLFKESVDSMLIKKEWELRDCILSNLFRGEINNTPTKKIFIINKLKNSECEDIQFILQTLKTLGAETDKLESLVKKDKNYISKYKEETNMSKIFEKTISEEKREEFVTEAERLLNNKLYEIESDIDLGRLRCEIIKNLFVIKGRFDYNKFIESLNSIGICTKTLEDILNSIISKEVNDITDLLEGIFEKIKIHDNKIIENMNNNYDTRSKYALEYVEVTSILNLILYIKDGGKDTDLYIINNFIKNNTEYDDFKCLDLNENKLYIKDNRIILVDILDKYINHLNDVYKSLGNHINDPLLNKYYQTIVYNIKQLGGDYFIDVNMSCRRQLPIDSIFEYIKNPSSNNTFSNYILNSLFREYNFKPCMISPVMYYVSLKPYDETKNKILKNILLLLSGFNDRLFNLVNLENANKHNENISVNRSEINTTDAVLVSDYSFKMWNWMYEIDKEDNIITDILDIKLIDKDTLFINGKIINLPKYISKIKNNINEHLSKIKEDNNELTPFSLCKNDNREIIVVFKGEK